MAGACGRSAPSSPVAPHVAPGGRALGAKGLVQAGILAVDRFPDAAIQDSVGPASPTSHGQGSGQICTVMPTSPEGLARQCGGISERARRTGDHAEYWNQIVNLCLEVLQGVEERPLVKPRHSTCRK